MDNKRFDSRLDRRKWPRMTWNRRRLLLWAGNTFCQDAEMLDESAGGIALLVRDGSVVHVGQKVRLLDGGRSAPAIVKYVHEREDGKCHLGLVWGSRMSSSQRDHSLA
jgi:hypothetical protein